MTSLWSERGETASAPRALVLGRVNDVRAACRALGGVRIIGVITQDEVQTRRIAGAPVIGSAGDFLSGVTRGPHAHVLILASAPDSRGAARLALRAASERGLSVSCVRRTDTEALSLRPLALDDLIGTRVSSIDWDRARALIAGKRVLVTGGAGSIGGALSRKLARLAPTQLSVFDNSEYNLYSLEQDLAASALSPAPCLRFGDIRDGAAVRRFIARERPDIVFHAAAMKHVPLVEANPCEGALTNLLGTRNVIEACDAADAHLVFVSTDKAANPASVMGATKRLMELYCQALDRDEGGPRRLVARLGNVLGSAGSVTPLFTRQIAEGGPLTVTHADVARYFITIQQAAMFLLQAAAVGVGTPDVRGCTHILDMGEPIRVQDIARDMIRLAGRAPDRDIALRFIGLRPGEKLTEDMIGVEEAETETISPGVRAAHSAPIARGELDGRIDRILAAARMGADEAVRRLVLDAVAAPIEARRAVG